jgi:SNF2 family DNA or RNA helicase
VEGSREDHLLDWDHRLFFVTAAGYEFDERHKRYLLSDQSRIYRTLQETIDYLREEGIEFELDQAATTLLQEFQAQQAEYEKVVQSAASFKETSSADTRSSLVRKLKPYQERGLRHLLAVKHGANFSVPGSGKTTVIYAAFDILRREGTVEKLLVIGPRSCFLPWEEESVACFGQPLRSARLTGSKTSRLSSYLQSDRYDLFLSTYDTAANDLDEIIELCKQHKIFLIIDESHNIKRIEGGKHAEAALRLAPYATRRAILSGTPVPNDLNDLWTQITFLWPGKQVLGDRTAYRYRIKDESGIESVRQAVRPFFMRVKKSELGLPPQNFERHECELEPYQASVYQHLAVKFLGELNLASAERQALRQWRKARIVRLIQAASNPTLLAKYSEEFDIPPLSGEGASIVQLIEGYPQYEMPAKISLALRLVHELLRQGEKVIVWTTFILNIKMLERLLADVNLFIVYGAIPRDATEDVESTREQRIKQFKETKQPSILLANPAVCAESISLHKICHHAIYLDRTFNCGQYMQSLDRIHRIGLEPSELVIYHILKAKNTIDDTIDRRLEEKQENMLRLIEDDLPVGTFEAEDHEMEQTESEEALDFEETMRDIKQQYGRND